MTQSLSNTRPYSSNSIDEAAISEAQGVQIGFRRSERQVDEQKRVRHSQAREAKSAPQQQPLPHPHVGAKQKECAQSDPQRAEDVHNGLHRFSAPSSNRTRERTRAPTGKPSSECRLPAARDACDTQRPEQQQRFHVWHRIDRSGDEFEDSFW
jgi:hypothetical protein